MQGNGSYLCPLREHSCSPEAASQIKTVLSSLPLAILVPSGEKHTDFTKSLLKTTKSVLIYKRRHSAQGNGTHLCPLNVDSTNPVTASHTTT